jgi:hypothetical protein
MNFTTYVINHDITDVIAFNDGFNEKLYLFDLFECLLNFRHKVFLRVHSDHFCFHFLPNTNSKLTKLIQLAEIIYNSRW